ncbi:cytochrome c biogenesis protein CcdA [Anaerocolumna sp. AGMB13025]|uniref:redoxin domain-containing protein n=1 Tax=Anaerocolumna sp. AGMB13025 TaxID=3039116 RepID=UPI00241D0BF6|nr:cytochrome c biogenesis protein CcdA [Anaerocolumna sp. AGMB13025]WFR59924.1 cytochrome c biogenesis protein CcdA [Anaerocolumna sp. AGMB13025]
MFVNIVVSQHVSFILVFLEGILSFFSPCVIPLIPVYMSYLAGNAKKVGENGEILYGRKKVFLHTVFFVIGISFAFFILGMSFTVLGNFFNHNKIFFIRVSGILIVLLGLFQLGVLDFSFLQKERKLHLNLTDKKVNPFIALVLGFTFSFAWTPCIGPALSSVLIMASGAKTAVTGYLLVLIYALGFVLPFLLLGLFTTQALEFLKSKQKLLKYTIKAGGIILILMGIMTFTGWMNGVSSYLNSISNNQQRGSQTDTNIKDEGEASGETDSSMDNQNTDNNQSDTDTGVTGNDTRENSSEETSDRTSNETAEDSSTDASEAAPIPAFDFTLKDQYGEEHTLSDYKGKVVFLNFWATWCPPCKEEMPHIEELYQEYNLNQDEVVFLGVTNPKSEKYPYNQDEKKEDIISFLDKNEYTFPTVFDETGEILQNYSITAFPTTFMIDKDGNVFGYVPGKMTKDIMKNVIDQTLQGAK